MGRSKHELIRTTDSEISISLLNEKGEEIETAVSRPTEKETQVHPTSPQRTSLSAPLGAPQQARRSASVLEEDEAAFEAAVCLRPYARRESPSAGRNAWQRLE